MLINQLTQNCGWTIIIFFVLGGICKLTCGEATQVGGIFFVIGAVEVFFFYPLVWSFQNDIIEAKHELEDCRGYHDLFLWTTIGTVSGVIFYLSFCCFAIDGCSDGECSRGIERDITNWRMNNRRRRDIKHVELVEMES